MTADVLIRAEGVGKKFCRSLKRGMYYAGVDLLRMMAGREPDRDRLRKEEFWALDGVSFELRRGECLGLIGPNGSGKTTMLRILNGILPPDRGCITIRGTIGGLIQVGAGFHPRLTGRENIYITGAIRGMTRRQIEAHMEEIVAFSGLEEFLDMPVQYYSTGMLVRLGYSVAAHLEPDILLLDEVLAVGDIAFRYKCLAHLRQKMATGCTPIFVTHNMEQLAFLCTRVIVFSKGRAVFDGDVDEGIAVYQDVLTEEGRKGQREPGRITYDPRAEVAFLEVASGREGMIRTGDDVVLRVGIEVREPVEPLSLRIVVESPVAGNIAALETHRSGIIIPGDPGRRVIEALIPAIPLLPGAYALKVVLESPTRPFMRLLGPRLLIGARDERRARFLVTLREQWRWVDPAGVWPRAEFPDGGEPRIP